MFASTTIEDLLQRIFIGKFRYFYILSKKYDKVKLIIDCTKKPPLRLAISLEVTSTKGNK